MCFIADGYSTVYEETVIKKSRKAHRCNDCHKEIAVGSSYRSVFSVYEGDATTTKMCNRCQSLRSGIVLVEISEGCSRHEAEPLLGEMFEQLNDNANEYHKRLLELDRTDDAAWLAANCRIDEDDDNA